MKNIIAFILTVSCCASIVAQSNGGLFEDLGNLSIRPQIKQEAAIDEQARNTLEQRLRKIITKAGISDLNSHSQFVLIADVQLQEKAVAMNLNTAQTVELLCSFYFADIVAEKVFSSTELAVKGVGGTEEEAIRMALKQINEKDENITVMLEKGKQKLVEYYSSQCEEIFQKVEDLRNQQQMALALATLANIPNISIECYERAGMEISGIYVDVAKENCMKREALAHLLLEEGKLKEAMAVLEKMTNTYCSDRLSVIIEKDKKLSEEQKSKLRKLADDNDEPGMDPEKIRKLVPQEIQIIEDNPGSPEMMRYQQSEFINQKENHFPE